MPDLARKWMKRIADNGTRFGPSIYEIRNRSLFALAKRWQFYTLEGDEGPAVGRRAPCIPSLNGDSGLPWIVWLRKFFPKEHHGCNRARRKGGYCLASI